MNEITNRSIEVTLSGAQWQAILAVLGDKEVRAKLVRMRLLSVEGAAALNTGRREILRELTYASMEPAITVDSTIIEIRRALAL